VLLGIVLAIPAVAQTGQQTSPKDPMATWLHNAFNTNRKTLRSPPRKFPRTFMVCAPARRRNGDFRGRSWGTLPTSITCGARRRRVKRILGQGSDFEKLASKAALLLALSDAFTYAILLMPR